MNEIAIREPVVVDSPNAGELDRAKELAASLSLAIKRTNGRQIQFDRRDAEELCQLLNDSVRTAEQLQRVQL